MQTKLLKVFIGSIAMLLILAVVLYLLMKNDQFQLFGEMISRVETDKKVIALTFDDGPTPDRTNEILRILRQEDVRATFFLNGNSLASYPAAGRRLINSGHEIGNHSYSHKRMVFMAYSEVAQELRSTDKLIREYGYQEPIHFRPPYGKKLFSLPLYLMNNGIKTITWDVEAESWDSRTATTEQRINRAVSGAKPGSIILMHVMHGDTKSMKAVPVIIQRLKAKGYQFLTVSELLARQTSG